MAEEAQPITQPVPERWTNRRIIFLAVVGALIFYAVFRLPTTLNYLLVRAREVLTLLIFAIALTYLLLPLVDLLGRIPLRLERHVKRGIASLFAILVFLALVAVLGAVVVAPISQELGALLRTITDWAQHDLARQLDTAIERTLAYLPEPYRTQVAMQVQHLEEQLSGPTLAATIRERVGEWAGAILTWQVNMIATVLSSGRYLVVLLIVPVFAYYFLTDATAIREGVGRYVPPEMRERFHLMAHDVDRVLRAYTRTLVILSVSIGVATALILYFAGVRVFLTFGIMAGVANLVPVLGGIVASVLLVAISLLTVGFRTTVIIMALYLTAQLMTDRVITPKLMSEGTKLHPVALIVAILVGAEFFGTIGVFIAVPVLAVLRVMFIHYQVFMSDAEHRRELEELIGQPPEAAPESAACAQAADESEVPAQSGSASNAPLDPAPDTPTAAADHEAPDEEEAFDGDA